MKKSQETYYISATEPNRLMLFAETVAAYCENHMEHRNSLCEENAAWQSADTVTAALQTVKKTPHKLGITI
jgi:hypothetical protein